MRLFSDLWNNVFLRTRLRFLKKAGPPMLKIINLINVYGPLPPHQRERERESERGRGAEISLTDLTT